MNAKDTIKNNFSRYAEYYDSYSSIQDHAGSKLTSGINSKLFSNILDIGCGTGNYTRILCTKFPDSKIKAVDISPEMVQVAKHKLKNRNIEFIVADAETLELHETFNLITSNACFQWFSSLENALCKYYDLLDKNGLILFSTFGPSTFHQLNKSLNKLNKKNTHISSQYFIERNDINAILEKYFDHVSIEEHLIKQAYPSLLQLLNTIKYTGTRGIGLNGQGLSKGKLATLEKIYKENFNNIVATYQLFYCQAQKRE